MSTKKFASENARRSAFVAAVEKPFAAGKIASAADARKAIAKVAATYGESADPASYYGFDGIYFRLVGLATPLLRADGSPLLDASEKVAANVLRAAVARRRDSGVRWETLAASTESATGTPVSVSDVRGLYAAAGKDPEASYVGRGTRRGAPSTRVASSVAIENATS